MGRKCVYEKHIEMNYRLAKDDTEVGRYIV